jgi:chloramphenicol O-acetyltransferase type A
MKRKVDMENWVRKAHFEFFSAFEEPYYGVCVNIDCSAAYRFAKRNGHSVFLYCLYSHYLQRREASPSSCA